MGTSGLPNFGFRPGLSYSGPALPAIKVAIVHSSPSASLGRTSQFDLWLAVENASLPLHDLEVSAWFISSRSNVFFAAPALPVKEEAERTQDTFGNPNPPKESMQIGWKPPNKSSRAIWHDRGYFGQ